MGMNAQLHLVLDSCLLEKLKAKAAEKGVLLSELCRGRLGEGDRLGGILERLDGIERTIEQFIKGQ